MAQGCLCAQYFRDRTTRKTGPSNGCHGQACYSPIFLDSDAAGIMSDSEEAFRNRYVLSVFLLALCDLQMDTLSVAVKVDLE